MTTATHPRPPFRGKGDIQLNALFFLVRDALNYARAATMGATMDNDGHWSKISPENLTEITEIQLSQLKRSAESLLIATTFEGECAFESLINSAREAQRARVAEEAP